MSKGEFTVTRWLEAYSDRNSQVSVLPRNTLLEEVSGDGDYKFVATDLKQNRLRIYKGVLTSDISLQDVPNSLITFYMNNLEPRIPAVAVACGSDLYIYKNNKPFFKVQVPHPQLLPLEAGFWKKTETFTDAATLNNSLEELSAAPLSSLSARSQQLLCSASRQYLLEKYKSKPIVKESPITCMCTLKKSSYDNYATSCPVLATESGNIYFLDPQTLSVLYQANTCSKKSTPFIITSTGIFDVEFRIIIACREGHICILRRGWLEGKLLIELADDIVDFTIVPKDNFIIVATRRSKLACFTKRGQNLWSVETTKPITCICLVPVSRLSINLIAVGQRGGTVELYYGRHIVDYVTVPESPSTITFGQLGQEENVMVVVTLAGGITYKILKRTADFNLNVKESSPLLHNKSIPLPKRSKLFHEQSLRERSNTMDMHQSFQQDLIRLRLTNALEMVTLTDGLESKQDLKIGVQVTGLGPVFTIVMVLENWNVAKCTETVTVIIHSDPCILSISPNVIKVPLIPPSCRYIKKIEMKLSSEKYQDIINMTSVPIAKIYVSKQFHRVQPDLLVAVNLPLTDYSFF